MTKHRVLHIDMPRALSTTLRAVDFRSAQELFSFDILLETIDLGIHFWDWVLRSQGMELDKLYINELDPDNLVALTRAFTNLKKQTGIHFNAFGFHFGITSTRQIEEQVNSIELSEFTARYVSEVQNISTTDFNEFDTISLGCTSADSLVFACAFSMALRRSGFSKPIFLGKHTYENFSLSIRSDLIPENDNLHKYFDTIVFYEEKYVESVLSILGVPEVRSADRKLDPAILIDDSSLFQNFIPVNNAACVVSMPISRNKCYWRKCTFCVQIQHHLEDNYWKNYAELEAAIAELKALADQGFACFIFSDQAVPPGIIKKLCEKLTRENIRIKWTVRIIADVKFNKKLMQSMSRCGCFEVLFGLETVLEKTAISMGKVSMNASVKETESMIEAFRNSGISIFLNLIYAFPTESDDDFLATYKSFQRLRERVEGITFQFNKFALFYGTDIYSSPQSFGLRSREEVNSTNNLKLHLEYEDAFLRKDSSPPKIQYFLDSLGLDESTLREIIPRYGFEFVETLFQLNYSSFGVLYKAETLNNFSDTFLESHYRTRSREPLQLNAEPS